MEQNDLRNARRLAIGIAKFAAFVLFIASIISCDNMYAYERKLSSPQYKYAVGDTIVLNFSLHGKGKVRLYENRRKSLEWTMYPINDENIPLFDPNFLSPYVRSTRDDKIESIHIFPDRPFQLTARGIISKVQDGILCDFGEFGTIYKPKPGKFVIQGSWTEINPVPGGSEMPQTNKIYIEIADSKRDSL